MCKQISGSKTRSSGQLKARRKQTGTLFERCELPLEENNEDKDECDGNTDAGLGSTNEAIPKEYRSIVVPYGV
jgi:hypothetical protein